MSVAVALERELEWGAVDWEELRSRRARVIGALPALRRSLSPTPLPEGEGSCSRARVGGALSLGERIGVRAQGATEVLLAGIDHRSPAAVAEGASRLAGLGEGSTPAGDDFLVGVLYALRAMLPAADAHTMCAAVTEAAAPLTTRTSAAWLRCAAAGNAIPTWNLFLSTLRSGDDVTIRERTERVLALGHTSGRAALSGFVATLDILGGAV